MISKNRFVGFSLFSILIVSLLTSNQISFVNASWPTVEWTTSAPINHQMSGARLNNIDDFLQSWNDEHQYSHVDQLVIIRNGYLLKEWYAAFYDASDIHPLWSVTKSFMCTLMGIAIKEGYIPSVNEFVLDYFSDRTIANVDARKEAITIEHLLLMSTGLAYPGDDAIWMGWMNADDQVQYILDQQMSTIPGTIFNYDTGGSHLLSAIIQEATGMNTSDFAEQYLFEPLGITHYYWQKDKQGIAFGGHGLYITPRDMAKLGYLYLNDGLWDGKQILPDNWVDDVSQIHWYFNQNWGYAKQWWTHPYLDAYSARGRYGQCIFVLPEENIVVAFTGTISDFDSEPYFEIIDFYVLPALTTFNVVVALEVFIPLVGCYFVVSIIALVKIRRKSQLVEQ